MTRPKSLAAIASSTANDFGAFDRAVLEFLDSYQSMARHEREASLQTEPEAMDALKDAYLAAVAEHLALSSQIQPPDWTLAPRRFLSEPFFAGGLESLKASLLVESPLAFRRRLIFVSANALSRPDRSFNTDKQFETQDH